MIYDEAIGRGEVAGDSDLVTVHGGVAADPEPVRPPGLVLEEAEELVVVVALQVDLVEALQRLVKKEVDDFAAVQPPVHVIAEIDGGLLDPPGRPGGVIPDHPVQVAQQVDPAVDVADRVHAHALGNPGRASLVALDQFEQASDHRCVRLPLP